MENELITVESISKHEDKVIVDVKVRQNEIRKLIFFVTNRCNFSCVHCFYHDSLNIKDTLDLETIKKIADGVGKLDTLLIAGGEPFLRKELTEICEYFIEKCNVRFLSIPTNGSFDKKVIEFVKHMSSKCDLRLFVSLDGLKETHNRIRGVDNFDKAMNLLKTLVEMRKEYDFVPMANITVSNKNLHEMRGLTKLLNEIGVHYALNPLRNPINPLKGRPKDLTMKPPTPLEWGEMIDFMIKERNFLGADSYFKNNKTNFIKKIYRKSIVNSQRRMYQAGLSGKRDYVCKAGHDVGVIDYEGEVFFCEMTNSVGNLKDFDWDFNKLWFSQKAEDYRPQILNCVCTHSCFINSRYRRGVEWAVRLLS